MEYNSYCNILYLLNRRKIENQAYYFNIFILNPFKSPGIHLNIHFFLAFVRYNSSRYLFNGSGWLGHCTCRHALYSILMFIALTFARKQNYNNITYLFILGIRVFWRKWWRGQGSTEGSGCCRGTEKGEETRTYGLGSNHF